MTLNKFEFVTSTYRLGHGDESNALCAVNELAFVCCGRETDAVRLPAAKGDSFKTPKVPCDWLKVGRDEVETDFQTVAWHFGRRERMA